METKEIWKPIKGYEGLYQVSSFGRVRSLNYSHTGKTKLLSPGGNDGGYLMVVLCKNGKKETFKVHRLVAEAFIPNWFDEPQVNHIDENKQNNHVDNLEWCSAKYNNNYGSRNERISKIVLQLTKNRELVKEWSSTHEAERNGFNHSHIVQCCNGRLKTHKGYIWRYK